MVILNFDKVVRVKFLLPAGFAESNTSLNTVFNQHRSSFYNSFCQEFNSVTEKLPADLILPTNVFIPLPGSSTDKCRFDIFTPKTSFFLNKLNIYSSYYDSGLYFVKLSILDIFKLSCLKSIYFNIFYKKQLQHIFKSFYGSLLSFNLLKKKTILFSVVSFNRLLKNTSFYKVTFNKDFKKIYFIL